ncbi:MAG: acyltransferase, partial [Vicinamibacterales bacterium]|nr:acyltransferase [Vicinamibacterales bacterium]
MTGAQSPTYVSPTYRREIDGLRALAVLPVIFFHAGFDWFRGGFVGVDVFFVISGYLITTVILTEQAGGGFSLVRFYERRARRILPALFFMLALTTAGAWVFLLPADLKAFAQSLTAVAAFYSNVLFAGQSGYFDAAAELKPLLHTWSLAVEEQFYLLFPLLLLLTRRVSPAWRAALLLLVGGASLAAAELRILPPAEAVFLLQTRGWAVIIGALAALYVRSRRPRPTASTAQLASTLGIALVLLPVLTFSRHTPFPGLYGLVPTLGTALVILFATPDTVVGRMLGSAPLVGMGLISYSAYLWHQPLFAFARHATIDEPAASLLLWLTLLTVVLAYISWRWVEQPFRRPGVIGRRPVFAFALAGSVLFAVTGQVGVANEGFAAYYLDHRLSTEEAELYTLIRDHTGGSLAEHMVDDGDCHFWTRDVTPAFEARFEACRDRHGRALIVLGDSHAMNVYNLVAKAHVDPFTVGVARPGCRP